MPCPSIDKAWPNGVTHPERFELIHDVAVKLVSGQFQEELNCCTLNEADDCAPPGILVIADPFLLFTHSNHGPLHESTRSLARTKLCSANT